MKENGFALKKKKKKKTTARSRQYPAKTITDAYYVEDIALFANTPTQAELLPHSLEQAASGISLYVNADKTCFNQKYMCFNKKGDISPPNNSSPKSVNNFTYVGSSISSTEMTLICD